jgi:hypothetical protein
MIYSPIRRIPNIMLITQKYKGTKHKGIDLRSRRFLEGTGNVPFWALQTIQLTENSQILRYGTDRYGNGYVVVRPLETRFHEIKYIHVDLTDSIKNKGKIFPGRTRIGKTENKGNSKGHHLHFEVLEEHGKWIDPIEYFLENNIVFRVKT